MKKAALYDPYLQTMGGGERLILSILQVLDASGYEITIFWDQDVSLEISTKLGITFKNLHFKPNIFNKKSAIAKLTVLTSYDMFFYVPDGSYFFSSAKRNFVYSMVPDKKLYAMTPLNKLKLHNYSFITISEFSKQCLSKLGIPATIIYPYLPQEFFDNQIQEKEKVILNVGRFFKHLHSKRQDLAIIWFKELKKQFPQYRDYTLVLAGSVLPEDEEYLQELQNLAAGDESIVFNVNMPFETILTLYNQAEYYWHFAGYGVDEEQKPERTEHLGITPMEAMARGCITCAYRAGGPKEIIQDGTTGILFSTQEELFSKMNQPAEKHRILTQNAIMFTKEHYSYETFSENVKDYLGLK